MAWRAFRLLNASERTWIESAVRAIAADWLADWMPGTLPASVHCVDAAARDAAATDEAPSRWVSAVQRDATVAIPVGASLARSLADGLLGGDHGPSALADDVLATCLGDLTRRLQDADAVSGTRAPAAEDAQRGSGAAVIGIELDASTVPVHASPGWVARQLAGRPRTPRATRPPVDPRQCLGPVRVRFEAWAGSVSLELGLLQTLAPGDVIRLDARVDQPMRVTIEGRETERGGYPGSVDGRRALQLVSQPVAPPGVR